MVAEFVVRYTSEGAASDEIVLHSKGDEMRGIGGIGGI